ncbi:MAG: DegT/DnrJ/EryC1/StrS family aminotransferase [Anaerolineae bacterium]
MPQGLAVDGGTPVRSKAFPRWPVWDEREIQAVSDVVSSGQWWAPPGTQVKALEREFAEAHDAAYAVAVANGSIALEVTLRAAGIDWGDEVITSPYTFIATANTPLLVGAIPRFADILPDTWNLDPAAIEPLITPRTKAILPVHLGGEPADMDAINEIAKRYGLLVIEDAAQAHGARWRDRSVGAIGDMGTFSFQASKNMTGGEGGIVLTNSEEWLERCWSVHNVGRSRSGGWYEHVVLASNYRLSEWPAAILRVQLTRLKEQATVRSARADTLKAALAEVDGLDPLPGDRRVSHNAYHIFKMWYDPDAFGGESPSRFAEAMRAEGIPISVGYGEPLHRMRVIVERSRFMAAQLDLPEPEQPACQVAEDACRRGLWLMQNVLLAEEEELHDVVRAAIKIQRAWRS